MSRTSVGVVALVLFRAWLRFPEVLVFDLDNLDHLGGGLLALSSLQFLFVVGLRKVPTGLRVLDELLVAAIKH